MVDPSDSNSSLRARIIILIITAEDFDGFICIPTVTKRFFFRYGFCTCLTVSYNDIAVCKSQKIVLKYCQTQVVSETLIYFLFIYNNFVIFFGIKYATVGEGSRRSMEYTVEHRRHFFTHLDLKMVTSIIIK